MKEQSRGSRLLGAQRYPRASRNPSAGEVGGFFHERLSICFRCGVCNDEFCGFVVMIFDQIQFAMLKVVGMWTASQASLVNISTNMSSCFVHHIFKFLNQCTGMHGASPVHGSLHIHASLHGFPRKSAATLDVHLGMFTAGTHSQAPIIKDESKWSPKRPRSIIAAVGTAQGISQGLWFVASRLGTCNHPKSSVPTQQPDTSNPTVVGQS